MALRPLRRPAPVPSQKVRTCAPGPAHPACASANAVSPDCGACHACATTSAWQNAASNSLEQEGSRKRRTGQGRGT
eukprot:377525-Alexandrium_andersonii.AAC.1